MKHLAPTFSYAVVEGALAQVLGIPPSKRGAFEARLRHLRQLGIPRSKNPGSGKRICYAPSDAAEMMIALLLQSVGCAPQLSVRAAQFSVSMKGSSKDKAVCLVLLPKEKFDLVHADRIRDLVATEKASSIVNVSAALAELEGRLVDDRASI